VNSFALLPSAWGAQNAQNTTSNGLKVHVRVSLRRGPILCGDGLGRAQDFEVCGAQPDEPEVRPSFFDLASASRIPDPFHGVES
jgi:hypothetical protein